MRWHVSHNALPGSKQVQVRGATDDWVLASHLAIVQQRFLTGLYIAGCKQEHMRLHCPTAGPQHRLELLGSHALSSQKQQRAVHRIQQVSEMAT